MLGLATGRRRSSLNRAAAFCEVIVDRTGHWRGTNCTMAFNAAGGPFGELVVSGGRASPGAVGLDLYSISPGSSHRADVGAIVLFRPDAGLRAVTPSWVAGSSQRMQPDPLMRMTANWGPSRQTLWISLGSLLTEGGVDSATARRAGSRTATTTETCSFMRLVKAARYVQMLARTLQ